MKNEQELKELVREKYSAIALQDKQSNEASCCGSTCCSSEVYNIMSDDYSQLDGYNPEADLGLGCGLPTEFANIAPGDVVIDLGSGAGNDAFIARHETGPGGKVIGIDFTPAMIEKARGNALARKFHNVEFREGDIENMPVAGDEADVIVSNCVLNLVPNKNNVLKEIFRALKPGGHFSISDIVLKGALPSAIQEAAEMYAGCVSGAIQHDDYLALIAANGFANITVQKTKAISIPGDILKKFMSSAQITAFRESDSGIFSITVYGEKPKADNCCGADCCKKADE